jgi:RHS repeat-associated protein
MIGYDNVGQLTGALGKEEGGGVSRLQEQFAYTYDAAGNLSNRVQNLLTNSFTVNNLNELTTETNSGTLTVAGTTTSAATNVSVYGTGLSVGAADIYADRTWTRGGAIWANGANSYTATASDAYGRTSTDTSTSYLQSSNFFAYDLNGNLRTNANQILEYDDENQLISITVSNAWRSEFAYDGKLRRRKRKEFTWTGSWTQTNEVHYVYDGMLVIQERDINNIGQVTYTRGKDLSGSLQGAGGIGGLLARTDNSLSSISDPLSHAFYHADGNGNITALISTNQLIVARYVYGPFGNSLSISGPLADANVYRFSSKEIHVASGMYYYGYRFYDPGSQRWLNRDPLGDGGFQTLMTRGRVRFSRALIAERGTDGPNLYGFVRNSPTLLIDPFGRESWIPGPYPYPTGPLVPPDPNFDKARNWLKKCHPELDCGNFVLFPLPFDWEGLTLGIVVIVAPGRPTSDYVDTIAHEGMHCRTGPAWGAAHDAIFEAADNIRREYEADPTGSNCKCNGSHPGARPPKPPPPFTNWGGF